MIRLSNGKTLILEVKGQDSEQNKAKRVAMRTWVQAVNEHGGFGQWCFDVVLEATGFNMETKLVVFKSKEIRRT